MLKIFFDTEFTGLHQGTTLISIGLITEAGETFYAEFTDYDQSQLTDWIKDNVIANLQLVNNPISDPFIAYKFPHLPIFTNVKMYGSRYEVADALRNWLEQFGETIEMWSDCLAYDWVLFCELFGGAFHIPSCVYYIPFDLSTLFQIKGIDPDIDRELFAFSGSDKSPDSMLKHNSLWDAIIIRKCYEKC